MAIRTFIISLAIFGISLICGSGAEAQTPYTLRPTYGRCVFPSARLLSSLVSQELKAQYQIGGYTNVWVVVKILEQRPPATQLTLKNVYGFQVAAIDPANPTKVAIFANADGVPIDMPCSMNVQISTQVYLTTFDGKQLQGTSTSTVLVAGAFN